MRRTPRPVRSELDWLHASRAANRYPIARAIANTGTLRVLCIDGADDEESGCHGLPEDRVVHVEIPGGHHFGGDYRKAAEQVARFIAPNTPSR